MKLSLLKSAKKRIMKKNNTLFILAMSALVLQSCGNDEKSAVKVMADEVIPVKVMPLEKSGAGRTITVSGRFSTDDETYMSFKTGGIVQKVLVREGDFIRKGQLLATLDLTEIDALVGQAKIALDKAERDLKRVTSLNKDGFATLEQTQNAQTGRDVAFQQYESAKFNRKYSEIRALTDGYVLHKMINAGQLVSAGTPAFETNGAGKASWILKAGAGDVEWSAISIGDEASVSADVLQGKTLKAKVVRKSEGTDPYNGSFAVELAIEKRADVKLASGMFGTAEVSASGQSGLWSIPYEALLDGNAGEGFVFVTDDNKTAVKVPVKISSIEKNRVLISSGLENHRTLIVAGNAYLTDKSQIRITQ